MAHGQLKGVTYQQLLNHQFSVYRSRINGRLLVQRRKFHCYLVMNLDYINQGPVKVFMMK